MNSGVARPESDLPQLRIVPTKSLVPHEVHDMGRSVPLMERLRSEGILKNPPIVAPFDDGQRYVILDGVNRFLAMSALAFPHVVVQVVDYDDANLILDTWSHLVTGMACDELLRALESLAGLRIAPADLPHARAELIRRRAIAVIVAPDPCRPQPGERGKSHPSARADEHGPGSAYVLYVEGDSQRRAEVLKQLVGVYESRGTINRVRTDQIDDLLPYYDNVAALVVFPRFAPVEIVEFARQRAYLPPGLTRHIVPGRVLRLNFPIDVLADDRSLEEKNAWLREWIRGKLANKDIRYYQESTFLFDE